MRVQLPGAVACSGCQWGDRDDITTQYAGHRLNGFLNLTREGLQQYGESYRQLSVSVAPHSHSILRMTITDPSHSRWRIPTSILPNLYPSEAPQRSPGPSQGGFLSSNPASPATPVVPSGLMHEVFIQVIKLIRITHMMNPVIPHMLSMTRGGTEPVKSSSRGLRR